MYKFRIWLANRLVKLAHLIRPKEINQFMQSLEDSFLYGNGVTRISPKEMFKESK